MQIKNNTLLITGGATGIGFSIAEAFINNGNNVIICGRRENRLSEARNKLPGLHTRVCDITQEKEREALFNWVRDNFSSLNILVNNAGIQQTINFKDGIENLLKQENEIETNLKAPVYLTARFIPLLMNKQESAIINISSSLAFQPLSRAPLYSVTKAAIHAYSMVLRQQLQDTPIKVFEIVPPIVDTELYKFRREKFPMKGITPSQLAGAVFEAVRDNEYEIIVGEAVRNVTEGKKYIEQMLQHHKPISP